MFPIVHLSLLSLAELKTYQGKQRADTDSELPHVIPRCLQ